MKRYEKVRRKWVKLKSNVQRCPHCFSKNVGLNDDFIHKIKRFYLECENCHWCGNSYPTINMAIRSWNNQSQVNI